MDNERVLWASPRKRVQKLSATFTGQSTTTSDRRSKNQSESNLDDTNYDLVAQLEFSPEVATLMSTYEAAELATGSDATEKHGKPYSSSVQSAPDLTSASKSCNYQATGTPIGNIEATHLIPIVALRDRPQSETKKTDPVSVSTSGSVAAGPSLSGQTSLPFSAGQTDKSTPHWIYNGLFSLSDPYSANHPPYSSSSSTLFTSFTPTVRPIPCTPLNPWYLSNGATLKDRYIDRSDVCQRYATL